MGTAEIKAELAARYPGISFARRFDPLTRIVVVTCDAYEDEEITEVNDVAAMPSSADLKDYLRP